MKPYQRIPILDCKEALIPIPLAKFAIASPHPYQKLGAPYGKKTPYYLRQGVVERLTLAQRFLQQKCPGWRIQIVDAYRPIEVQQFMVDYTFAQLLAQRGLTEQTLIASEREGIWQEVFQFWATPSTDPMTPPPHSTGAAIDVTLVSHQNQVVDMGSPIDEVSPRSIPDYFAPTSFSPDDPIASPDTLISGDRTLHFHQNRQLLREIMHRAGFRQHPNEWWHFSWGDQLWAWQMNRESTDTMLVARYGRI